jgi:hypothetical protein
MSEIAGLRRGTQVQQQHKLKLKYGNRVHFTAIFSGNCSIIHE